MESNDSVKAIWFSMGVLYNCNSGADPEHLIQKGLFVIIQKNTL